MIFDDEGHREGRGGQEHGSFAVPLEGLPTTTGSEPGPKEVRSWIGEKETEVPLIKANTQVTLPVHLLAVRKLGYTFTTPLTPGCYPVYMLYGDWHGRESMRSNKVEIEVLPPGLKRPEDAQPFVKQMDVGGVTIESGFIPYKTTLVWGEPLYVTFMVRNTSDKPFRFSIGGIGPGLLPREHPLLKITVLDAEGRLLPDPEGPRFAGRSGGLGEVHPGMSYTERVQLDHYRAFSGAGTYRVTCRFEFEGDLGPESEPKGAAETTFEMTILPHTDANVRRVIDELVQRSRQSTGHPLAETVETLCSFAGEEVVPPLAQMVKDGDSQHRAAALRGLGRFTGDDAVLTATEALQDPAEEVRIAAAGALGNMKTDAAVEALAAAFPEESAPVAAAVLRAMGETRSAKVFRILVGSLAHKDGRLRRAAADGLVSFGGDDAVAALKACLDDDDMDFREFVILRLVETGLEQPLDPQWFVPVIRSRRNPGAAPRLLRLYAGEKAVPTLLGCMDFDDPFIRDYYNYELVYSQAYCQGGLKIPWISDLNRDGTPEEIEQNRRTLKIIKAWVEHYDKYRTDEEPSAPLWDLETWGERVDGIRVCIQTNQRVWPEGMPQLVVFKLDGYLDGGFAHLRSMPQALEAEINGRWHVRHPPLEGPTEGADPGLPVTYNNVQLDEHWRRKSDGEPLQLTSGKYTLRLGLSMMPESRRTGLAISQPIRFEVIPTGLSPAGAFPLTPASAAPAP